MFYLNIYNLFYYGCFYFKITFNLKILQYKKNFLGKPWNMKIKKIFHHLLTLILLLRAFLYYIL